MKEYRGEAARVGEAKMSEATPLTKGMEGRAIRWFELPVTPPPEEG